MLIGICLALQATWPARAQTEGKDTTPAQRIRVAEAIIVCPPGGCRTLNIPAHCKIKQFGGVGPGLTARAFCDPQKRPITAASQPRGPAPRTQTSAASRPGERRVFCSRPGCRTVVIPPHCRIVQYGGVGRFNYGRRICDPSKRAPAMQARV
ncbi:MAG: hypothetical protein IT537_19680 [Hyphomicrobiales bacterium]|nr:hypothetical protein [Hyphomicrobiales bacterium]